MTTNVRHTRIWIIRRIFIIGTLALFFCAAANVRADCTDPSPVEGFRQSDLVFEGELIAIVPAANAYTFRVRRVLKGEPGKEVVLFQEDYSIESLYPFVPDTNYLVYAKAVDGGLLTGGCYGNRVLGVTAERQRPLRANFVTTGADYLLLFGLVQLLAYGIWFWSKQRRLVGSRKTHDL
jgi:hypothetical protein